MEIKVSTRYLKQAPRKLRLVADLVRGKNLATALNLCQFSPKVAATHIKKLLISGQAAAVNNFSLDKNNLYVKSIQVDQGPSLKRWRPRAHGRAARINHFTSHLWLSLAEVKDSGVKASKKLALDKPVSLSADKPKALAPEVKSGGVENLAAESATGVQLKSESGAKKGFTKKMFRRKSG